LACYVGENEMESVLERNKCLIEWTSGLFGLFWGVWWGVFLSVLLSNPIVATGGYSLRNTDILLCCSAVLVSLFVYFYVRWLWAIRNIWSRTYTRTTRRRLWPALVIWFCFSGVTYHLGALHQVPFGIVIYGVVLTFCWMLLNIAVLTSY
jgi:hypothetical protein